MSVVHAIRLNPLHTWRISHDLFQKICSQILINLVCIMSLTVSFSVYSIIAFELIYMGIINETS